MSVETVPAYENRAEGPVATRILRGVGRAAAYGMFGLTVFGFAAETAHAVSETAAHDGPKPVVETIDSRPQSSLSEISIVRSDGSVIRAALPGMIHESTPQKAQEGFEHEPDLPEDERDPNSLHALDNEKDYSVEPTSPDPYHQGRAQSEFKPIFLDSQNGIPKIAK